MSNRRAYRRLFQHDAELLFAIQLATGANALATATAVRARIAELSTYFPPGLKVVYPNDSTPFIKASITEVVKTLLEGIALVFLVMLLFLQNIRATIIPTIAVPVVLLGTFGVMAALGFTINTPSMFGLVLAIGLLVDDAIVVLENVERVMAEEGLSAREATRKASLTISKAALSPSPPRPSSSPTPAPAVPAIEAAPVLSPAPEPAPPAATLPVPAAPVASPAAPGRAEIGVACPTQVRPEMPAAALRDGVDGVVKAQLLVHDGTVRKVTIISGPKVFHAAVKKAAAQYKCANQPNDVVAVQEFVFKNSD